MARIISLFMIFTVIICTLIGCKKNQEIDNSGVLQGQTIKISAWWDPEPQAGTELNDARIKQIEAAEKKYGCKIEYVNINDPLNKLVRSANSGENVTDVCYIRMQWIKDLEEADAVYAIDEIGNPEKPLYYKQAIDNAKSNGKTYAFWYDPYLVEQVVLFNKNILDRAGVQSPYSLVENKKWTYDAWLDIMQKTTDINSGIMGCGYQQAFDTVVMKGNNASYYAEDNGKWIANTSDNKLLEAYTFLQECINKWKVLDLNWMRDWTYTPTQFKEGRYATTVQNFESAVSNFVKDMPDDYGVLPIPIGPSATDYARPHIEIQGFVIPKTVSKEKAVAILEFMDEAFCYPFDNQKEHIKNYYSSLVRDKESLDVLMMLQDYPIRVVEEYNCPDIRTSTYGVGASFNNALKGDVSVRSALDSEKGKIQAMLDEYYGQK